MGKVFILIISMAVAFAANAGNESGGGMGVVCRDASGSVESVELLDFWEARHIYGRDIKVSNTSVRDQVEMGLQQLKHTVYADGYAVGNGCYSDDDSDCIYGVEALYKRLKWDADRFLMDEGKLPQFRRLRGVNLTRTDDSLERVTPVDCEIEQIVRYIDTAYGGEILINQDLVDKMDNTNVAGLYLHEVFYALLRNGEKSSLRVRRTIGLIASGYEFRPWDSFIPNEYYDCSGKNARAFVYLEKFHGDIVTTSQFVSVDGRRMIGPEMSSGGMVTSNLEDAFNNYTLLDSLNKIIGFDYSVTLQLFWNKGVPMASMQLYSAPDIEEPSPIYEVECKLVQEETLN